MANLVLVTGSTDWSAGGSWDTASAPVDADNVYLRNSSANIVSGLSQSGIQPALIEVERSFTGDIGAAGTELAIGPVILNVGRAAGVNTSGQTGSDRLKFTSGTDPCAVTVFYTATTPADLGLESFRWRGTDAGNTLVVHDGVVGIATNDPDDTATLATFFIWNGTVNFGAGCTLTTGVVQAGLVSIRSAMTTFTQNGGDVTILGSGAITTLHVRGGTCSHKSTGTVTTLNLLEGATLMKSSGAATITTMNWAGTIDLTYATGTITFTNTNRLSKNAKLIDPFKRAVFTNPIANAADVFDADGIIRGGGGTIQLA